MTTAKILLATLAVSLAITASGMKRWRGTGQMPGIAPLLSIEPGERVRERYLHYLNRLKAYHELLSRAVLAVSPDQLAILEPAARVAQGYQILPKIAADGAIPAPRLRRRSSHYSWPATERLIHDAMEEMARAEEELKKAAGLALGTQQKSYERLVRIYRQLRERQQSIDAHIQYNRLWQADIVARRASYDRWTALHDAVLEREAIRDRLAVFDTEWVKKGLAILGQFSPTLANLENRLAKRQKLLDGIIDAATGELRVPGFVRLERRPGAWIIHVPFYTDIHDRDFVAAVKKAVEGIWRLRHGGDEFRVVLADSYVPASLLYTDGRQPKIGDSIETQRHLARFPPHGAILTTGAVTTHVYGRAVILGPHEISPRVLAHEFGHILGFKDNYFRGYRDLGVDGFEVFEVIAGDEDIMGSPSFGEVRHDKFMRLLQELTKPKTQLRTS